MKRELFLLMAAVISLLMVSCNKDDDTNSINDEQGVVFALNSASRSKSTDCFSKKADYAKVNVDGSIKKVDVYYVNSRLYTKTLKLAEGEHVLKEFMLMDDNNTPDNDADDVLIAATPHEGSEFAKYIENPLDLSFEVKKFKKTEMPVSVLCYQKKDYSNFGFIFFGIEQIVVREQAFFGDICICRLSDYEQSPYAAQTSGLQLDMPAIAKIEVWRNNVKIDDFTNEDYLGEGKPLVVKYADILNHDDNFELKLFVLVKQANEFKYKHFHSWKFKDDETIAAGDDGIVEFVLGNCADKADVVMPAWMNLPPDANYTITSIDPTTENAYVGVKLENIADGYEIVNGLYPSNCADHNTPIHTGKTYKMNVYSSLYPEQLPKFAQSDKWEKFNWLYNHLDWYPGYKWNDIQGFMWLFDKPVWDGKPNGTMPAITEMTKKMKQDADKYGVGYKVPLGGTYVIIFIPPGSGDVPMIQTMVSYLNPCK